MEFKDLVTGLPDPVKLGHNLAMMHKNSESSERHELKAEVFRLEYLRNFEASEPKEEWDDRNRLYSAKTDLMFSACYAGSRPRKL